MTAALEGVEWSAGRPGHTLPPGKTWYPFYRRLGGPQGQSGRAENLIPTGIRSRTVQPVAQSLYRLSYSAHLYRFCIYTNTRWTPSTFFIFQENMCTECMCSCMTTPVFQIMNLGKSFAFYLGKFSNSRGRKVKSLLSKLLGFWGFAHFFIYKMSATFQELGLFD